LGHVRVFINGNRTTVIALQTITDNLHCISLNAHNIEKYFL